MSFNGATALVKIIKLAPDANHLNNRVDAGYFDLFVSNDNSTYTPVPRAGYTCQKSNGVVTITFNTPLPAKYLKLHVWFDDRTEVCDPDASKVQFINQVAQMLQVYLESNSETEQYQYDGDGNRTLTTVTLVNAVTNPSLYYANSDRLLTDGNYAFAYDNSGNLIQKGNTYTISGNQVTFTTSGTGVVYWEYTYDLLNRLIQVTENGTIVAAYGYDPSGLREVKRVYSGGNQTDTIHYIFEGTEPILEQKISDGSVHSYVYALGKYLARVDGEIGDSSANVYYFLTDYQGSIKAVTDQTGAIVFNADYTPFGTQFGQNGSFVDEHGFTGKEYDPDIGLYYFNARWYDPEIGQVYLGRSGGRSQ